MKKNGSESTPSEKNGSGSDTPEEMDPDLDPTLRGEKSLGRKNISTFFQNFVKKSREKKSEATGFNKI